MTSILFTTGPANEVRKAAEQVIPVTFDVEEDRAFPGFEVAIDLFGEVNAEELAGRLSRLLDRPVRTLESLDV